MDHFLRRLEEYRNREKSLEWEGTFIDYLDIVKKNPRVAQTAHSRVYDMIIKDGVSTDSQGNKKYHFFTKELFGLDQAHHPPGRRIFSFRRPALGCQKTGPPVDGTGQWRKIHHCHAVEKRVGEVLHDRRRGGLCD